MLKRVLFMTSSTGNTISRLFVFFLFGAILAGCTRAIPLPGDANKPVDQQDMIAQSYVIGKKLELNITQAEPSDSDWKGRSLLVDFLLPNEYRLYELNGSHYLLSKGNYLYSLDFYQVNQAMLNLEGADAIHVSLFFDHVNSGRFVARSNKALIPGVLKGYFKLRS